MNRVSLIDWLLLLVPLLALALAVAFVFVAG
jgi:hypothetical protein